MATNGNHFQDEPVLDGVDEFDEPPADSRKIEFDGLKIATSKAERRRERRRRRNERTGKIAACIILICIIIAIILSITLVKETEHILYQDSANALTDSPSFVPTQLRPQPTPSPTIVRKPTFSVMTPSPTTAHRTTASPNTKPTFSPTESPAPTTVMENEYRFNPVADTYLYLDGPNKGKIYGHEETFWVQHGNKDSTRPGQEVTIPTIIGIIQFNTRKKSNTNDNKILPNRSRWPPEQQVRVTLRINHVPKNDLDDAIEDIQPINMEIYRLPNSNSMIIESLTGDSFQSASKEVTEGILIGQSIVQATDTVLDIDVTSAMFLNNNTDTQKSKTIANNDITSYYTDDQVMFLLKISWTELPRQGDQFKTRESNNGSPELIFSNMT